MTHRPALWYLSSIELFEDVSEEDMHRMVTNVIDHEYENKQFVYTPKDLVENVYILKTGEITLYQSVDGKKVILDILKPGAVFGNIDFDPAGRDPHYAEVTQPAYLCTLPKNYFLQILQTHPAIALRALKILSKRLQQSQMHVRALSALHARDRILATIRLLQKKDSANILPEILREPTKTTHEKLGQMTGLTRETVTKEVKKLEEEQLIVIQKQRFELTQKGMKAVKTMTT